MHFFPLQHIFLNESAFFEGGRRYMNKPQNCIIQNLQFSTENEKLIILLNFRSLSFIANSSLFFITQYCFLLNGEGLVAVITFNSRLDEVTSIERYMGQSALSFIRDVAVA